MVRDLTPAPGNEGTDLSSFSLSMAEHSPLPMVVVEGDRHLVCYVNPAFCRLLGQTRDYLIGKSFCEMLPEKDQWVTLLDRVHRTGNSESHLEQGHSKPHPGFRSFTMWPVMADELPVGVVIQVTETAEFHGKTIAMNEALILGSVRQHELIEAAESLNAHLQMEIIARQKTARELSEKARLLDLSNDAIIVRDYEGRILYWNHGAEELYGWSREEALGKVSHSLLKTEFPIPIGEITEKLHRNDRWTGELVHSKRDGQRITVLVRKALDRDAQKNPVAVLQTITDITERKKMENELCQAHAQLADRAGQLEQAVTERMAELTATNQQLEAFVYSIAHDLRAPLRSMQAFSAKLVEEAGAALSETGKDYANRINHSAQFMDALLMDLLAFSRISQQRVELTSVNLKRVIELLLSRLQKDIQERCAQLESSGPWPVVLAHEPTLTQALFHLVSNALKFVGPGVPPLVRLRAEEKAEFIRVWVEDNGFGIAPDHQGEIFRPFTRLDGDKYAGTGIGLAIVQKGIERMGGRVGVESGSGQGSRFWFELRRAEKN